VSTPFVRATLVVVTLLLLLGILCKQPSDENKAHFRVET
jgi:hypothetical protein